MLSLRISKGVLEAIRTRQIYPVRVNERGAQTDSRLSAVDGGSVDKKAGFHKKKEALKVP